MTSRQFDVRHIPDFNSTATVIPIMEWLEDLKLIYELCEITKVERVLTLQLKGAAWKTYRQLSKEQQNDTEEIKCALVKTYRTDSFVACLQVPNRFACLEWLVGEMLPECWMKCALIDELPSHVRGLLWSSTRMETIILKEQLERAHVILVNTKDKHVVATAWFKQNGAQVLGLTQFGERATCWYGNEVPIVPHILTEHSVFSICRKLDRH